MRSPIKRRLQPEFSEENGELFRFASVDVRRGLSRKRFPPDLPIFGGQSLVTNLAMEPLEVDLVTIFPENHRRVGAIDDPSCLQLDYHQIIWPNDPHVTPRPGKRPRDGSLHGLGHIDRAERIPSRPERRQNPFSRHGPEPSFGRL